MTINIYLFPVITCEPFVTFIVENCKTSFFIIIIYTYCTDTFTMNKLMCMSNETIIIYSLNNNIRAIKDNCIKVYIFSGKSI